jgi:hypothetical protein
MSNASTVLLKIGALVLSLGLLGCLVVRAQRGQTDKAPDEAQRQAAVPPDLAPHANVAPHPTLLPATKAAPHLADHLADDLLKQQQRAPTQTPVTH